MFLDLCLCCIPNMAKSFLPEQHRVGLLVKYIEWIQFYLFIQMGK